jgi:hypothetical protein
MHIGRALLMGAVLLLPVQAFADGPPCAADMEADRAALFAKADADGNGTLSLEEFKNFETLFREQMAERHFAHVDANGDGVVSLQELQAAPPGPPHGHHGPPPF